MNDGIRHEIEKERTMSFIRWTALMLYVLSMRPPNTSSESVQSEVVDFGKAGKIKVEAHEQVGQALHLVFENAESGRVLETIGIEDVPAREPPRIRFRVMHIDGLPDPLILAVINTNGASDCYYYPIPIARVSGKFRRLLSEAPEMDTQGGFSLGSLGRRGGLGLAIWTFKWGPNESHYDHHRYRLKFYRWSQASGALENRGSELTRRLDDGIDAALAAGINADDIIDAGTLKEWFPEYSC